MPAHVFLDRTLDTKLAGREERRIKAMLKVSRIPTDQTLENFDFAFQPAIERSRIETPGHWQMDPGCRGAYAARAAGRWEKPGIDSGSDPM
jgi:hypothetical protein